MTVGKVSGAIHGEGLLLCSWLYSCSTALFEKVNVDLFFLYATSYAYDGPMANNILLLGSF